MIKQLYRDTTFQIVTKMCYYYPCSQNCYEVNVVVTTLYIWLLVFVFIGHIYFEEIEEVQALSEQFKIRL